jgi:hypothetical protein
VEEAFCSDLCPKSRPRDGIFKVAVRFPAEPAKWGTKKLEKKEPEQIVYRL